MTFQVEVALLGCAQRISVGRSSRTDRSFPRLLCKGLCEGLGLKRWKTADFCGVVPN